MTGRQENVVFGGGVINTGNNNQISNAIGDGNRQVNSRNEMLADAADPWLERLEEELARIRVLLENEHGVVDPADRGDALDAVSALQSDLPGIAASGSGAPDTLRRRLKGLLGALDPVAKIIGTVATVQGILDHFK
jgi:hypothetical protein